MISIKQKINRFLRASRQYKKFIDIVSFIISLLTPEQLKILEIQYEGEVIDFKIQLSLYLENRYKNRYWDIEELKTRSTKALNKYKFLFETNLNPLQIRTILLRELVEVISFGFLCDDRPSNGKYRYIGAAIKAKYPNLPPRKENKKLIYFWQECADCNHKLIFRDEDIKRLWYSEFFKRTKWYFEQLNSCESEYIDKYREKIYQEIRLAMGMWNNESFWHSHAERPYRREIGAHRLNISRVKTNTNIHLKELVEEVLSYFSEEELSRLEKIDSRGETWSFKEQLLSRYYSKYPSFVPLEEIKSQIKKRVEQYKPLLLVENQKETTKELFLDELEKGIFIPEDTHFWNQEMIKNLNTSKTIWNKRFFIINWEIQKILNFFEPENKKAFCLEIGGKQYDLKTLFIARWGQIARRRKLFRRRKFKDKAFSTIYLEILKNKDMSKFDMQLFLEKMDFFFLIPRKLTPHHGTVLLFLLAFIFAYWILFFI